MLITTSLSGIRATEYYKFENGPSDKRARLIGIIFCRPNLPPMKDAIIPSLQYFHFRSGGNTAFYFGGFESDDEWTYGMEERDLPAVGENTFAALPGPDGRRWYFIPRQFNLFRAEVERETQWKYSGGCDMILLNSRYDSPHCHLDFSTSVLLRLDLLNDIPSMPSVNHLFEKIFQYAEAQDPNDPTWGSAISPHSTWLSPSPS
jgi:hypothetical protein